MKTVMFVRRVHPKEQARREQRTNRTPRRARGFPERVKKIVRARSGGVCEIDACGPATEYHHRRPRGAGGTSVGWVNRAANALHLALGCHLKAEGRLADSSRTVSGENGWLVSQNGTQTAAEREVLRLGDWVLLTDDGGVRPAPKNPKKKAAS